MKMPNKVVCYNESIISKFPVILNALRQGECSVLDLYKTVKRRVDDTADFLDVLDCLFALGKIRFNQNTRRLSLCCVK